MADYDIKGASILSNGWVIALTYEGMSAAGTHDLGLDTDNDPTNANIVLSLTSEGYNVSGTLGTTTREIYGVPCDNPDLGAMRKADPNDADPDETVSGSDLIVNYALSQPIFNDDTSITVDVAAGTYNDGTDNNAANDYAVTNNSTLDYPKVVGNWAIPQSKNITESTIHLEFLAFHGFAKEGKPVAAVKFTIEDESANSVTTTITEMSASSDTELGNPLGKILVYQADLSVSTLTDDDQLTITAVAYPWVGDANSILDTDDAVNTFPTPLYTNLLYYLDKADDHGKTCVDSISGNDGTGTVYSTQAAAEAGNAFLTIPAAVAAMQTYNNTNAGHNDAGGGIIFCKAGTYACHTNNGGTMTRWLTIKPATGESKSTVTLTLRTGQYSSIPGRLKVEDITWTGDGYWYGTPANEGVWLHDCDMQRTGSVPFIIDTSYSCVTNCVGDFPGGFGEYSVRVQNYALLRGNDCDDAQSSSGWVIIGNNNIIVSERSGVNIPFNDNLVFAYNTSDNNNTSNQVLLADSENITHGVAVIQNSMIRYGSQIQPMIQISADGTTTTTNNVIIWNNTVAGARVNFGYNDIASGGPYAQTNWSIKNNIFSNWNNKDDTFDDNSDATGGWPVGYKVNSSGNHFRSTALDEWLGEFKGLWAKWGSVATPLEPSYVDDQSADGGDTSGGDYHLEGDSPSLGLSHEQVLPYDLDGRARAAVDNPGAWTYKEVSGSNWFYNKMIGGM